VNGGSQPKADGRDNRLYRCSGPCWLYILGAALHIETEAGHSCITLVGQRDTDLAVMSMLPVLDHVNVIIKTKKLETHEKFV
jgi:hypothetical protein